MKFGTLDVLQVALFILSLAVLTPIIGSFMAKVFSGEKHFMKSFLGKTEELIYRVCRINPAEEMNWKEYTFALLAFNFAGFILLLLFQEVQQILPFNPQHLPAVSWDLAINTAVSFVTNTNWQSYAGETTMSNFVQMVGLTVQNFLSAATGIVVILPFIRGIIRKTTDDIGNFWVDVTRTTLYILLPLSVILAIILVGQGTVQTLTHYHTVKAITGQGQVIPVGPAASQIAIKQLGSNGGGFFNANGAHPFENPTPLTDFLEMLSIILIASGLVYTYGRLIGSMKQALVIWSVMLVLFVSMLSVSLYSEWTFHPAYASTPTMEGKETRFGITNSVLWEVATTSASNGSVNAMHDSMTPLSGMVALVNMMTGEVIFGGVGAGLYGMFHFILLTVFIAGLMVGRTPEYLGKKIEAYEVKMAVIGVVAPSAAILVFTAIGVITRGGLSSLNNSGPHGFSEILYAFTSAAANNGSAFAGLNTNTVFYNLSQSAGMVIGRYSVIVPVLAISGSLARKKSIPPSPGTFPTDSPLFGFLLIGIIIIISALTFFPALALGPIVEHFLMLAGKTF